MAYEKNTWATGDVVTSAKLNHMEDGIGSAVLVVSLAPNAEGTGYVCDKTWREIDTALRSGILCVCITAYDDASNNSGYTMISLVETGYSPDEYTATIFAEFYTTTSPDGYPTLIN